MKKILWIGNAGSFTGLSRVTHALCDRLGRYEIHILAINYNGDPFASPYHLYPAAIGEDPFGFARVPEMMQRIRPDLVVIVEDLWNVVNYLEMLRQQGFHPPVLAYIPIDGQHLPWQWAKALNRCNRVVVPTEFGRRELERAGYDKAIVIPHGVERCFYRLPDEERKALRQEQGLPEDALIILNANRNQARKDIPVTIQGFCRFAKHNPEVNALLYLHLEHNALYGWDIADLFDRTAKRYGVTGRRLILSHLDPVTGHPNSTLKRLNQIYNLCDIGVNTSQAEGWGQVAFEHALTGAPQIVPGHSASGELWEGIGRLLPPELEIHTLGSGLTYWKVEARDLANDLEFLSDPTNRQNWGEECQRYAESFHWDWNMLACRFQVEIEYLLNPPLSSLGSKLDLAYADYPGGIFNPSLIRLKKYNIWMGLARAEKQTYDQRRHSFSSADPYLFMLDSDGNLVGKQVLKFDCAFDSGTYRVDDFRFFEFQGQIMCSHVLWRQGERIREAISVLEGETLRCMGAFETTFAMQEAEKNWAFFEHDGRLLCLYGLTAPDPFLRVHGQLLVPLKGFRDWLPQEIKDLTNPKLFLSLSSGPTVWDEGSLLIGFHQRDYQGIYRHWFGLLDRTTLAWQAFTPDPVLVGGGCEGNHPGFLIVGSATRQEDFVWVAIGEGDQYSRIERIPVAEIFWQMVVETPIQPDPCLTTWPGANPKAAHMDSSSSRSLNISG